MSIYEAHLLGFFLYGFMFIAYLIYLAAEDEKRLDLSAAEMFVGALFWWICIWGTFIRGFKVFCKLWRK